MAIVGVSIPALAAAGSPAAVAATGGTPGGASQILTNLANGGGNGGASRPLNVGGAVGSQVNLIV
jgi:hypothetical protein